MELPLDAGAEGEVGGEGAGVGWAGYYVVGVDGRVGEAGAPVEGVDEVPLLEEVGGEPAPGEDAVGDVPGFGAGLLRAQVA